MEDRGSPPASPRPTSASYPCGAQAGQRSLAAAGLMDYNARWYSPSIGRFASADTIVPNPGNPQGFNRYTYGLNNPLRYNDPSGHFACSDDINCNLSYADLSYERERASSTNKASFVSFVSRMFEITFTGGWSRDDKYIAARAVADIGDALMDTSGLESASAAFTDIFTPLEFRYMNDVCGDSNVDTCGGDAFLGPRIVRFWSRSWTQPVMINNVLQAIQVPNEFRSTVVVHELGHIFDQLTNRLFSNTLFNQGIRTRAGFSPDLNESWQTTSTEIAADYFVNYIYSGFTGEIAYNLSTALDNAWSDLLSAARNYP